MKPTKNGIRSKREFTGLCFAVRVPYPGFRINHQAIRYLRLTSNVTVSTKQHLVESLSIIFKALSLKNVRTVTPDHLQERLVPGDESESDDEAEVSTGGDLSGEQLHGVHKVLDTKREEEATYYLVDWEPTCESRKNLSRTLIARFSEEPRALARHAYIEDEAKEDNSLNSQ